MLAFTDQCTYFIQVPLLKSKSQEKYLLKTASFLNALHLMSLIKSCFLSEKLVQGDTFFRWKTQHDIIIFVVLYIPVILVTK